MVTTPSINSIFDVGNQAVQAGSPALQQKQLMEQQQAEHDAAVGQGKSAIDAAFSQFTPDWFNQFQTSYLNAYNPQLNDQYKIAMDQLQATLAGTDQLDSGVGHNAIGRLGKTYNDNQTDIANRAADATNQQRATIDKTKAELYGQNAQAADPLAAAANSQAQAASIVAPQAYPTLGNVFGDAVNSVASFQKSNQSSMNPLGGQQQSLYAPTSGPGSSVVTL